MKQKVVCQSSITAKQPWNAGCVSIFQIICICMTHPTPNPGKESDRVLIMEIQLREEEWVIMQT